MTVLLVDFGPLPLLRPPGDSFVDLLKCFHLKRGSPVQFSRLPIAKMMKAFKSRTQVNLAKDRNYVLSLNDTERESFTVQQSLETLPEPRFTTDPGYLPTLELESFF